MPISIVNQQKLKQILYLQSDISCGQSKNSLSPVAYRITGLMLENPAEKVNGGEGEEQLRTDREKNKR